MFGTYRTLLAVMVIFLHLGGIPVLGAYAVFGFYILSGYLMTFIMHQNYGYTHTGRMRYALNRILRIYPIYWLSCVFSLFLITLFGQNYTSVFHPSIYSPADIESLLRNIFLFFPGREEPRLTPPSWALTVEIFFYICIGLGLSKNKQITKYWFSISLAYTAVINIIGFEWADRYYSIAAASLPFSTGAIIFHYRENLKQINIRLVDKFLHPYILISLMAINWLVGFLLGTLRGANFYINYFLCTIMLIALFDRKTLPFITRKFDKLLGDFS